MIAATCHTDRPAKQRGMCGACYERARRRRELPPRRRLVPSCHPDRPHHAKGLCKRCYGPTRDRRAGLLRQLYGLSRAEFEELVAAQEGRCAICHREALLVVDHDHDTGAIRALLCNSCNRALGLFGDDEDRLADAIVYLRAGRRPRLVGRSA